MRSVVAVLLAAALGVSSAFLVACGDRNSLLPKGDAQALQSDLELAGDLNRREECKQAEAVVERAQGRAERLPESVDPDLRSQLEDNLAEVFDRIDRLCGKGRTQTTPTQTQTQTTATTPTTEPPPTTTSEPPPTTTDEPPPTTTSEPPAPPPNPGGSGGTPTPPGQGRGQ